MNTSRNITDLPLEVLSLIFKELPRLEERLSLAQVHPHLGLAFSCYYGQSFKNLNVIRWNMKRNMLPVILSLCGSSVEHIYDSCSLNDKTLKLVEQHCPNLQSIYFFLCETNINSLKSFLANVRSLSSIGLDGEYWPWPTNFGIPSRHMLDFLEHLEFQPSLRILHLSNFCSTEVLGMIIQRCLKDHLNIHELCHRLEKLRTLKILRTTFTASKGFDGVPCPALREVHISDFRRVIPKRFSLSIFKWILSHAERLETLMIDINITDYKPEDLIYKILSECKNLRSLRMRMPKVGTDFADRVAKIVS